MTLTFFTKPARLSVYKRVLHQFKSGDWSPEFILEVSRFANGSANAQEQLVACSVMLATGKPALHIDGHLLEWTNRLINKHYWSTTDRKLANALATAIDQYDSWSNYQNFFDQLILRQPRSLCHCPALLVELAGRMNNANSTLRVDDWLTKIAKRNAALQSRVLDAGRFFNRATIDTVAVVGNSPGLLESDHGEAIDSADCVLRFNNICLLYTSPSPRDRTRSRMPSSA